MVGTSPGGIEYYATGDEFGPQSFGEPSAGGPGMPPAPSTSYSQQRRIATTRSGGRTGSNVPWRIVIPIGIFVVLAIIGAIASRGTTSANRLDVGDCFVDPGFGDFSSVDDQDCGEPHDIQIFAKLKSVPSSQANTFAQGPESAGARCEIELFEVLSSTVLEDPSIVIPDDVGLGMLTEADTSSTTDVLCTIESPSGGLVGSVIPEN